MNVKFGIILLIFCVFMGVTGISLGLGTAFPSINDVAKPLVCPGTLDSVAQVYRPYPGKTVTTRTWYCTDASGEKTEISKFLIALYAGGIYGLILFVILFLFISTRRRSA